MRDRNQIELDIKNNPLNGDHYFEYGLCLEEFNPKQAYLAFENAIFHGCKSDNAKIAHEHMDNLAEQGDSVQPCSIVILSYNQREYTQKCLESIRDTTLESSREIVIVDNASEDDSLEYLREQSDIVLVANDFNAGFPGGCNIGIRASKRENDIFLLNNDTVLCANSLFWLRMGLYESEDFGATGSTSMSNYNLQSAVEFGLTLDQYQEFALKNNVPMERPYEFKVFLLGYAVLIKRDVLESIGYLDEQFNPGYYEDNDLGIKILQKGKQNVLVHNSFLIHWGGQTFNKTENSYRRLLVDKNRAKFKDKFGFNALDMKTIDPFYGDPAHIDMAIKNENLGEGSSVLIVGCGLGASLANAGWTHPTIEIYGLDRGDVCAGISSHLKGCSIAEYKTIDSNPFKEKKFDLIIMDVSNIKKTDLSLYTEVLNGMIKQEGTLFIIVNNLAYYANWLSIMKKEGIPDTVRNPDLIWEKDIYDLIKAYGFIPSKWVFFFSSFVSDESKRVAEQIKSNDILSEKLGVFFKKS